MSRAYDKVRQSLQAEPRTWLITGVAGFIGSHLLEALLGLDQRVVGLDNLATGKSENLAEVRNLLKPAQWERFRFIEGDIRDAAVCSEACRGVDYVLHQAALGSVPRSIADPLTSNDCNVTGFLNMLVAARDHRVSRFVYASSSSVYGDHPGLPKLEAQLGRPLSPYAVTKLVNELYASVFTGTYGIQATGLRYFNVFGPRQDPNGPYAAVIPQWVAALIRKETVYINGDGSTSRDFCYVANVVQANILAATAAKASTPGRVFNVALNARTTLNELFALIRDLLAEDHAEVGSAQPVYRPFRGGDVAHSQADITLVRNELGYEPTYSVAQGLREALSWYRAHLV